MKKLFKTSLIASLLLISMTSHAQFGGLLKGLTELKPATPSQTNDKNTKDTKPIKGINENGMALLNIVGVLASSSDENEELEMGNSVAATLLGTNRLWNNNKAQNYINLVGRHIALQSERKNLNWTFGIIDTPSINAFAAPGGTILVTRGLFSILDSEDELAAVLAHEISHVNRQHHYNVMKKQKLVEIGSKLAASKLGEKNNPEMTKYLTNLGGEMIARGLDKDAEFEADRDGIVLAARAGYNSSSMIEVLSKLDGKDKSSNAMKLFTSTHPSAIDRISLLSSSLNEELEKYAVASPAQNRIKAYGK
jgi:predicted Zn-dependent protease